MVWLGAGLAGNRMGKKTGDCASLTGLTLLLWGLLLNRWVGLGFWAWIFIFNWVMGWSEVMVKLCFSKKKKSVWF